MSDPRTERDGSDITESTHPPATARWVYALGIIALVLVLAFVAKHLAGGVFRRHGAPVPVTRPTVPRP